MSRTLPALAGVAAVQLVLVAVTWWPRSGPDHQARDLLDLPGAIDRIVIDGRLQAGESEPVGHVELKRAGDRWVMPELYDFPVDNEKITELLDRVSDLTVRAPVAQKATSHSSLNVAADDHARTLTLYAGDASVALVLGAASGQAVHIRRADEEVVYNSRGWNAWAIGDNNTRYWDSRLVTTAADAFDSLTLTRGQQGFTLSRQADTWVAAGHDMVIDDGAVDALLERLASLRLAEVVGTTRTPDLDAGTRLEWTALEGEQITHGGLSIGSSDGANTVVQIDGSPWVVRVPASSVRRWTEIGLSDLEFVDDLDGL